MSSIPADPGRFPWTSQASRYLRAAPFPHLSTVLALCAAGFFGGAGYEAFERGLTAGGFLLSGMASGWLVAAGLCQADAASRYREYRRVKAILLRRGFCRRTLRTMSGSRCRRDAALLAAGETGHGSRATRYFRELGYRRRHLTPDVVATDPWQVFDRRFLRTTFVPGKLPRAQSVNRRPEGVVRGPDRPDGGTEKTRPGDAPIPRAPGPGGLSRR